MAKVVVCLGATLGSCLCPYGDVNVTEAIQPITTTSTSTTSTSIVLGSDVRRTDDTVDHDLLACIRSYEGQYDSNTGNGYYGAYQFDLVTWHGVGGVGLPSEASKDEQDMRAWELYQERGLQPWPTPAKYC